MRIERKNLFLLAGFLALGCVYYLTWIFQVQPSPDRDGINQYYLPFLNYVYLASFLPQNFSFFSGSVFNPQYPHGSMVLAYLVSIFKWNAAFFSNPYLLNLIYLLPLSLVPFICQRKNRVFCFLLLLFSPAFCICLRGFSLLGFNVVFFFCSYVFLRRYILSRNSYDLIGYILFGWFGIITKQLGLFYFCLLLPFLAFLIYSRKDKNLFLSSLVLMALCIPFYNLENLVIYLEFTFRHNPALSFGMCTICLSGFLFGLYFFIRYLRNRGKQLPKNFLTHPCHSLIVFLFGMYLCSLGLDENSGMVWTYGLGVPGAIFGLFLLVYYRWNRIRDLEVLYILISLYFCTMLYTTVLGRSLYNFLFPSLLLLIRSAYYLDHHLLALKVTLVIMILISNFFPSLDFLEKNVGVRGANLYINGFNNVYTNLLGWDRSDLREMKTQMLSHLTKREVRTFAKKPFYLIHGAHFYTRLALETGLTYFLDLPYMYRVSNFPPADLPTLMEAYRHRGDQVIEEWVLEGRLAYFIDMLRPYSKVEGVPPELHTFVNESNTNYMDTNGFSKSLAFYAFRYIMESPLRDRYEKIPIGDSENPRMNLYIYKDLKIRTERKGDKLNEFTSSFAADYWRMEKTRKVPAYLNALSPKFKKQLLEELAVMEHDRANEYMIGRNFVKAYPILRRAYELNPESKNIRLDLKIVEMTLPASQWEILSEQGFEKVFE